MTTYLSWQNIKAGEREVQKALRKMIYVKYQIEEQYLLDKGQGIRIYLTVLLKIFKGYGEKYGGL